MTITSPNDSNLLAIAEAATLVAPGAWEHDTEENEGAYGAGPGARQGFKSYVMFDGQGRRIFDCGNSEIATVQEEYDEDGAHTWDESGRRVFEFSATFDPPTVLALIRRAQAAERQRDDALRTAPCLYPSAPGETRAGYSSDGVCVEGSKASIKAVAEWHHSHSCRPAFADRIKAAEARAQAAEAERDALRAMIDNIWVEYGREGSRLHHLKRVIALQYSAACALQTKGAGE